MQNTSKDHGHHTGTDHWSNNGPMDGSFIGHIMPAVVCLLLGTVWNFKAIYRMLKLKRNKTAKKQPKILLKTVDFWEMAILIVCALIVLLREQLHETFQPKFKLVAGNKFIRPNNWEHCTIYFFYVIAGITKILVLRFPRKMPRCAHHATMALAFLVSAFLMYFHTHGKNTLSLRIHQLLAFTSFLIGFSLTLLARIDNNDTYSPYANDLQKPFNDDEILERGEMLNANKLWKSQWYSTAYKNYQNQKLKSLYSLELLNSTLIMLKGTWLFQAAYILYPTPTTMPWNGEDTMNVSFATMFYTWHVIGSIMISMVIYFATTLLVKYRKKDLAIIL